MIVREKRVEPEREGASYVLVLSDGSRKVVTMRTYDAANVGDAWAVVLAKLSSLRSSE